MKRLALKLATAAAFLVWFLGLGLSWALDGAGVPHAFVSGAWRMAMFVFLLLYAIGAPRKSPESKPPPESKP